MDHVTSLQSLPSVLLVSTPLSVTSGGGTRTTKSPRASYLVEITTLETYIPVQGREEGKERGREKGGEGDKKRERQTC